jgi:hypothetical protein
VLDSYDSRTTVGANSVAVPAPPVSSREQWPGDTGCPRWFQHSLALHACYFVFAFGEWVNKSDIYAHFFCVDMDIRARMLRLTKQKSEDGVSYVRLKFLTGGQDKDRKN